MLIDFIKAASERSSFENVVWVGVNEIYWNMNQISLAAFGDLVAKL
jgi:hypothetical protein